MATVIDSLYVTLGLDATKFDAAQKKSVESLRKFDTANAKSAKESQIGSEKMADGFLKVKGALLGFAAAAVGVSGFKDFINQQVFGNAQLGRTSVLLGMNARELDSWGAAVKTVGGTAQGFQQSMQNIEGGIAAFQIGQGGEGVVNGLARLGVQAKNGTVSLTDLSGALVRMKEQFGVQASMNLAQQIGLDQGTFQLLLKGPAAVRALHDQFYALSGVKDKNIQSAQKLQGEWALLKQSADALGQTLFGEATPALEGLTEAMVKYSSASTQAMNKGGFMALFPQFWKNYKDWVAHPMGGSSDGNSAREQSGKVTGGSSLPRNMRNNNPGNLEYGPFAKAHGATGTDGRFAIFPSMAVGSAAQAALLARYKAQGIDTISGVVSKYSPAGDNGAANTNAYISDVARRTGIDPNQHLQGAQWASVQSAMAAHEGMTGAKVAVANSRGGSSSQVETNIGTINVNTRATDANGIAKDMHQSLQQNALISGGTTGNS